MAIVAILLVNMLIAMMGNTYQKIAETRNEWQRQVGFSFSLYFFPFIGIFINYYSVINIGINVTVGTYSFGS